MIDKLNHLDYCWYVVRTRPRQEKKFVKLLEQYKAKSKNILEVYAPTHTTVTVRGDNGDKQAPLFVGIVFVLATQKSLIDFMEEHAMEGVVQYERKTEKGEKTRMRVIPEEQMRAFRDFNENYAEQMIILERPYTDYAFNPKTGNPNEIVRVIDGPLKGREGYIARFRRDKRLVFQMRGLKKDSYLTVSLPNIWNFHVVRLHNAEGDRLSIGTEKGRAIDLLIGILQACGYGEQTLPLLYEIIDSLIVRPSLVSLCQDLHKKGNTALSMRLAQINGNEAELILNLVRYEHDNPGYVRQNWQKLVLRPYLTPTAGITLEDSQDETKLQHTHFTEIIRKIEITEEAYYPSKKKNESITTTYYAHIGILKDKEKDEYTFFANWDEFLGEYFLTAEKANEKLVSGTTQTAHGNNTDNGKQKKLIESFRNYAPSLYKVLTDTASAVKTIQRLTIGTDTLNVMAITTTDPEKGKNELIKTCTDICQEINTTTHLAIWRRYLQTVWLHQ